MDLIIEKKIRQHKKVLTIVLAIVLLGIVPVLLYFHHTSIALGVIAGSCVGAINLYLLVWGGKKIFSLSPHQAQKFSIIMSLTRLAIFALAFTGIVLNKSIESKTAIITALILYQSLALKELLLFKRES